MAEGMIPGQNWDEAVDPVIERPAPGMMGLTALDRMAILLVDHFELDVFTQPVLHMDRVPLYHEAEYDMPDFGELVDVNQLEGVVYWSYEIPTIVEETTSLSSSHRETEAKCKYKLRHDFVSEGLTEAGTDRRLDQEFEKQHDEDDRITPDIIHTDDLGIKHVIEIGTDRSPSYNGLLKSFLSKMFKYEMALRARATTGPITYTVILVGNCGVMSNHRLPQSLVTELVARMTIASAIENVAKGKGINLSSDGGKTDIDKMAKLINERLGMMDGHSVLPSSCIGISDAFVESVLKDPDSDRVAKNFAGSIRRTQLKLMNQDSQLSVLQREMTLLEDPQGKRSDMKPVTVMPLVNVPCDKSGIDADFIPIGLSGENEDLSRVWRESMSKMNEVGGFKKEDAAKLKKEAYLTITSQVEAAEKTRKVGRREWHRVNLKNIMSGSMVKYLQKDGLFGKRNTSDQMMKERRKQQKKPFWINTMIDDLHSFLEDLSGLDDHDHDATQAMENVLPLIEEADRIAGNPGAASDFVQSWCKCKLFESLEIISDIAYELAAAVKQNTKTSEFILKKLRNRQVYILIKPTNSQSHVFYSIMIPKSVKPEIRHKSVFRAMFDLGLSYATEFCSVKASKIENLANASSLLLSLASFWSEFYDLSDARPASFKERPEAYSMLTYSLLVSLEDKACTEEIITNTRYMYMEIFKGNVNVKKPNPFKMMSKMPSLLRSRLSVFTLRQVVKNFTAMVVQPPKRVDRITLSPDISEEDAPPDDSWEGLRNFVTGGSISTASAAINLMYIGYFKNKNQEADGNTEWKMVEKILEEEFGLNPDDQACYRGEVEAGEEIGKKQFDKHNIMHGCRILETRLSKSLGFNWKNQLEQEICTNLAKHLTHEIATLKASSMANHNETGKKAELLIEKNIWRVRVIEAIGSKLGLMGDNPMINIDRIIKFIEESSQGVVCDLFKKNQHGGLREIYVLTIESRLVQLFIETISRTISSHFEEETLTHPGNKIRILDNHKTRMAREARKTDSVFGDLCSSSDKTRWNQNFVMPAMSIPLLRMTTPKFHNAIKRILNLWANKLILIPPNVINLLIKQTPLSSDVYMELLSKFWGRRGRFINKRGVRFTLDRYLNLTSGMMQGILHYTSSLLHLTFLASSKALVLSLLKKTYKYCRFFMSQVCSSDDSATILTVMTSGDSNKLSTTEFKAFFEADLLEESLTDFCQYYCMRESVKSTTSVYDYVEFNSEFLLKNTLSIPVIKFVAASLNLTESSSFITRFQNMYNLLSSLRSSGMSSYGTYLCQVAQAWQHYKTMGSSNSALFSVYSSEILNTPSPVHGFFLFDNHLVSGVLGYSFTRWLHYLNCSSAAQRLYSTSYTELEVLPDGGIVESLRVKHGDNVRWMTMLDRIETQSLKIKGRSVKLDSVTGQNRVDKDVLSAREDLINSDPELFFRDPLTVKERRVKLLIKASMPGVADSLGKGNPFIQSLGLSIYCLFGHAFTQTTVTPETQAGTDSLKKVKTTIKHSILSGLRAYRNQPCRLEGDPIPPSILEELFPLYRKYELAYELIQSYQDSELVPVGRMRVRTSTITVQPRSASLPLSLLQTVAKLWYQRPIRCSARIFSRCLMDYQISYPWISDTFEETLVNSPFERPIELFNFLSTQNCRSRKFKLFGPAIYSTRLIGQLGQIIRKGYKKNTLLIRTHEVERQPEVLDRKLAELTLALQIPYPYIRSSKTRHILESISDSIGDPGELVNLSRRDAKMGIIALFHTELLSNEMIPVQLKNINQGIMITFTKPQRRVVTKFSDNYVGKGEAIVLADGMQVLITMFDNEITSVTVKDFDKIRQNPSTLRQIYDQVKCTAPGGFGVSRPCVARFNGTNFVSSGGFGTPILVDPSMEDVYADPALLVLRIRKGVCGLYQTVRGEEVAVVQHRTGLRDVSLHSSELTENSIWDAWTSACKLNSRTAYKEIVRVNGLRATSSLSDDAIRTVQEWFSASFSARLKYKGLGYSSFSYAASIPQSVELPDLITDDDVEALLNEVNDVDLSGQTSSLFASFSNRVVEAVQSRVEEEDLYSGIEGLPLGALNLEMTLQYEYELTPFRNLLSNITHEETEINRTTDTKAYMNYLYLHPMWDDLIDEVERDEPNFFYKTLQGVVSARNPDMSRDVMQLLKIKEKKTESTIAQRFASVRSAALESEPDVDYWDDVN